jgi:hypothetical protein
MMRASGLVQTENTPYEVLMDTRGLTKHDGIVLADSQEILVGDLVAKVSGYFQLRKSTLLTVAGANMDTEIEVEDARAWKVGDAITVVGESADVVADVDYDTNIITLTTGLTDTRAIGVRVHSPTNDANKAVGIWAEGGGYRVVGGKSFNEYIAIAVTGNFQADKIRNFDADARTDLGGIYRSEFNLYHI